MIDHRIQRVNKKGAIITAVDPQKQLILARMAPGQDVPVYAYTLGAYFRWPKVGERWILREENGSWLMDSQWEEAEKPTEELKTEPGDAVIGTGSGRVLISEEGSLHVLQENIPVGRGTTLPSEPVDGQEYDYIVDATKGIIWRFRYRSESASAHKWEFVGGPAFGFAPVNETLTFTAAIAEKEFATKLTVPLAGDYNYIGGVSFFGAEGEAGLNEGEALLGKNGALISLTFGRTVWNNAWEGAPLIGINFVTAAAGDKLGIRVAQRQAHASHVYYPQLQITPTRVG